jgi:hypothetical protein
MMFRALVTETPTRAIETLAIQFSIVSVPSNMNAWD